MRDCIDNCIKKSNFTNELRNFVSIGKKFSFFVILADANSWKLKAGIHFA